MRRSILATFFLLTLLCGGTSAICLQAAEWREVFNPHQVLSLYLKVDPADWDRVRRDQPSQSEDWVPQVVEANFYTQGELPLRVTVRRKGESDTPLPEGDPQKVSLKIDVNALIPGQKWRGLTKLSLENGSTDPLNEGFAWMLHHQAIPVYGYEAANAAWVKVFINGDFKGVFVNVEQRNTQFLQNHGYYKEGARPNLNPPLLSPAVSSCPMAKVGFGLFPNQILRYDPPFRFDQSLPFR